MSDYRSNPISHAARSYGQQYTSYTSSSTSYSTSDGTGQQYTKTVAETAKDDGEGTTVERRIDETGKPTVVSKTVNPVEQRKIEDVTDATTDDDAGKRYEEAMEEEYAKREGGA